MPVVEAVWPLVGDVNGGTLVSLAGSALAGVRGKPSLALGCAFDAQLVPARFVAPDTVQCAAPAHTPGIVAVAFTV